MCWRGICCSELNVKVTWITTFSDLHFVHRLVRFRQGSQKWDSKYEGGIEQNCWGMPFRLVYAKAHFFDGILRGIFYGSQEKYDMALLFSAIICWALPNTVAHTQGFFLEKIEMKVKSHFERIIGKVIVFVASLNFGLCDEMKCWGGIWASFWVLGKYFFSKPVPK